MKYKSNKGRTEMQGMKAIKYGERGNDIKTSFRV
jgi:hypothetical protein